MLLHEKQRQIILNRRRFNVIRAGRKGGKTTLETENMGHKAISDDGVKGDKILYIAPTQIQARKIIWESLKARFGSVGELNEQRLELSLPTEAKGRTTIMIGGWENRENYRGLTGVKHITFDETDSMKDFYLGWQEIFRPLLLDTGGGADFIGTPKKENPNMKRLEKDFAANEEDFAAFHFTSADNPYLDKVEIEAAHRDMDVTTYRQEILAEYVDNAGALFKYDALLDVFSNTIVKRPMRYLIVDIADDGSDKTVFSFWEDLEEYKREEYGGLSTEMIIGMIREKIAMDRIPMSRTAVDAIGIGAGVASSSLLQGIVGFKSSFAPIKTDTNIVLLPNVSYRKGAPLSSDYKNLRSQCLFTLADKINNHAVASKVVGKQKETIIEELSNYQDESQGDGKRMATPKEKVKEAIGHSPDASDTWIMRMYFVIREKLSTANSEEQERVLQLQQSQFSHTKKNQPLNSSK